MLVEYPRVFRHVGFFSPPRFGTAATARDEQATSPEDWGNFNHEEVLTMTGPVPVQKEFQSNSDVGIGDQPTSRALDRKALLEQGNRILFP
jgi:hypothetical protein